MNDNSDPMEYLTVEELKEEFPKPAKQYKWSTNRLVAVWKLGGIDGEWDNTIKRYLFRRGSIIRYLKYVDAAIIERLSRFTDFENFDRTGS